MVLLSCASRSSPPPSLPRWSEASALPPTLLDKPRPHRDNLGGGGDGGPRPRGGRSLRGRASCLAASDAMIYNAWRRGRRAVPSGGPSLSPPLSSKGAPLWPLPPSLPPPSPPPLPSPTPSSPTPPPSRWPA